MYGGTKGLHPLKIYHMIFLHACKNIFENYHGHKSPMKLLIYSVRRPIYKPAHAMMEEFCHLSYERSSSTDFQELKPKILGHTNVLDRSNHQPPQSLIYMHCTGGTECLSRTPGSHSACMCHQKPFGGQLENSLHQASTTNAPSTCK